MIFECETASLAAPIEAWSKESLVRSCWRQLDDVYMSEKLYEAKQVPRGKHECFATRYFKPYVLPPSMQNHTCAGKKRSTEYDYNPAQIPPCPFSSDFALNAVNQPQQIRQNDHQASGFEDLSFRNAWWAEESVGLTSDRPPLSCPE